MKKHQIISEVTNAVRKALDAKLTYNEYSEYIKGSMVFRFDLIPAPDKYVAYLDLPSKNANAKPLRVEFKRRYVRRTALLFEVNDAVEK